MRMRMPMRMPMPMRMRMRGNYTNTLFAQPAAGAKTGAAKLIA
jgi:hypothetical protein